MIKAVVWLLIVTSDGYYNRGTVTNVGQFPTLRDCEFVQKSLPGAGQIADFKSRCIQATVMIR